MSPLVIDWFERAGSIEKSSADSPATCQGVFEPVPVTRKWKAAHGHGLSDGSFDSEHTRLELWNRIIALPMLTQAWKETEECKTQGAAR